MRDCTQASGCGTSRGATPQSRCLTLRNLRNFPSCESFATTRRGAAVCSYSAKATRELSCTLTVLSDESCTFRPKKEREEQTIYERTVSRQARDRFASLFSAWSAISSFSKLKFRIICECSGESLGGIVSRKCYGGKTTSVIKGV